MPNDSVFKTITVAFLLCIVCSILVSTAAVSLRPIQKVNQELDKKRNILMAAGLYEVGMDIDAAFENIEAKMVDLASGDYVTDVDPSTFDPKSFARNPETSISVDKKQDIAGLKRRPTIVPVYFVRGSAGEIDSYVFPVNGMGLWGQMYGFVSMGADLNTVKGFAFYNHMETPGLGAEVDNPKWKSQWPGKKIFNSEGSVSVKLVKGGVNPNSATVMHEVDSLSGATLTSRGVENLVKYWFSATGFGKFLTKLQANGG